jgi:hypothetical protein
VKSEKLKGVSERGAAAYEKGGCSRAIRVPILDINH